MKKFVLSGLFILSSSFSFAAPATEQEVKQLLQIMQVNQIMDDTLQQLRPMLDQQAIEMVQQTVKRKNLTPEEKKVANKIAEQLFQYTRQIISRSNVEQLYQKVYQDVFSQEEIQAQIQFYASPVGQSILKKTPQIATLSTQIMSQELAKKPSMQQTELQNIQKELENLKQKK